MLLLIVAASLLYFTTMEVTTASFLAPLLSRCISSLAFGELFGASEKAATLVSIIGVFMITGNHDEWRDLHIPARTAGFGVVVIVGVASSATVIVVTRKIGKNISSLILVNYFAMCAALWAGLVMVITTGPVLTLPCSLYDWITAALQCFGAFGRVSLSFVLRNIPTHYSTVDAHHAGTTTRRLIQSTSFHILAIDICSGI